MLAQAPGTRGRGEGKGLEGPGEIGGSTIEIIRLVERGERMGWELRWCLPFYCVVPFYSDIAIYLFLSSSF